MYHGKSLRAWIPLHDCSLAISRLEQCSDTQPWRVEYVSAVTLLRSVGHVLANIDAGSNPVIKSHLTKIWDEVNKDRERFSIFWRFIKGERDRVLKTYEFGVTGFDFADPAILRFDEDGNLVEWPEGSRTLYLTDELDQISSYSLPMDAPSLMREGVQFWHEILTDLEFYILPHGAPDECPF